MLALDSPGAAVDWLRSRGVVDLEIDSRRIGANGGFIAWPGAAVDGRRFVGPALAQGAAACLVERQDAPRFDGCDAAAIAALPGLKAAAGPIAADWYGRPTDRIDLFAVTGTNGKTSTTWWLAQTLSGLAKEHRLPCAMIGTLGIGLPPAPGAALSLTDAGGLTTPDPVTLQRRLRHLADDGAVACAIEASSIGLAEERLAGCRIRVAIFTNLSQDHLDYHVSMDAYWQAKRRLFDWPGLQAAVLNIDDPRGSELAAALADTALDVWTVSRTGPARLRAQCIEQKADRLRFDLSEAAETHRLDVALLGDYNVSNLLGVIAALRAVGVPLAAAVAACRALLPVPGRMEHVGDGVPGRPLVVVDYAHTPDALAQLLGALQPAAAARGGRLLCVFGCGGDRDRSKRAPMAAVVERMADRVVLTSDNPRSEDPRAIIADALAGLRHPERAVIEPDRMRAIRNTIAACPGADVVCIAGKGHETTQEIGGRKIAFSDQQIAGQALAQWIGPAAAALINAAEVRT